jgi:hypothetical protein
MSNAKLKASLAVVANAPSVYVITNGRWGAPNIAVLPEECGEYARLFAAAPDLLETCKKAVEAFNYLGGSEEIIAMLEKTIARAEGRE